MYTEHTFSQFSISTYLIASFIDKLVVEYHTWAQKISLSAVLAESVCRTLWKCVNMWAPIQTVWQKTNGYLGLFQSYVHIQTFIFMK